MTADELCRRLKPIVEEYPVGSLVWHRADGKRGVVCEYCIDGQACVMVVVSFGGGINWEKCEPYELRATRCSDGTDGEDWKDGKEGASA